MSAEDLQKILEGKSGAIVLALLAFTATGRAIVNALRAYKTELTTNLVKETRATTALEAANARIVALEAELAAERSKRGAAL